MAADDLEGDAGNVAEDVSKGQSFEQFQSHSRHSSLRAGSGLDHHRTT